MAGKMLFKTCMHRKSSRHHRRCTCHSSWTALCHAGTMAGPPMPAEGMRSFPDADSHASMVRSLGVCNDRGTYPGELTCRGTPRHVKVWSVCAKQGTSSACHHMLQPGGTRNHSYYWCLDANSNMTGSKPTNSLCQASCLDPRSSLHAAMRRSCHSKLETTYNGSTRI